MATRSGSGTGVVVSLVVFVLCSIFLLVLTIVFYAGKSKAIQDGDKAQADLARFVTRELRNREQIKTIESKVNPARGESVVGALRQDYERLMDYVSGEPTKTLEQLQGELKRFGVAEDSNIRAGLTKLFKDLEEAKGELEAKNTALTARETELAEKDKRMVKMVADHKDELDKVTAKIDQYQVAAEEYREQLDKVKGEYQGNLDRLEGNYQGDITRLENEKDSIFQERVILKSRLDELQSVLSANRLKAKDPSTLVDAMIADTSGRDEVFINRGAKDRIVLGITFEVYDSPAALQQIDPVTGEPPRGKASLQVTEVRPATSKCKITRAVPGRPVVRNDVVANAVYDPNYVFKFLVHGKFDVDGDGTPTEEEAEFIRSEILKWHGQVVTGAELPGDLDFLVLGVEPPRPMSPRPGATDLELEAWVQRRQSFEKYAELFKHASEAQIPVLNANRFFILIGHTERERLPRNQSALVNWTHYIALRGIAGLMHCFDVDQNLATAATIGSLFHRYSVRHRDRALAHIQASFPEWPLKRAQEVARRSLQNMFQMFMVDILVSTRRITTTSWPRYLRVGELAGAMERLVRTDPTIFITGHVGNWELLGYSLAVMGYPLYALARPLDNPQLNRWVMGLREARGMRIITKWGATPILQKLLSGGGRAAFIADQNAGEEGLFVPFFGRLASSYKSIGLLAMRYEIPIVAGFARRLGGRFEYELAAVDIIRPDEWADHPDPLFYITARYNHAMEQMIRRAPEQYLWVHRRWKSRPRHERLGRPMPSRLIAKLESLPWLTPEEIGRIVESSNEAARQQAVSAE